LRELVLDASATVRVLAPVDDAGFALQARLLGERCVAPHLIDAEVGHVLRRRVAAGDIEASNAEAALMSLTALVVERYPHTALARAAWALRHNLSYYDALYAALAARLRAPLLTADKRLANAPGLPCEVEVIS
jgi:predicted nucleic acid-binding protein